MNKKQKGNFSEFFARCLLRLKGYMILEKNYVTGRGMGAGEIDIIAHKKKTIVFVEVKNRKSFEKALYALKKQQQQRIERAAEVYLAKHKKYQNDDVRFDVVLIGGLKISHIPNAWMR